MHLTPREIDKLVLHQAGVVAQKRLARGLRLNYVEAVALIATQLLEFIRDGRPVAELMDLGRRLLGREDVLDGVAGMIHEVQVEGTFPDGTKLVTVHHPVVAERGDLSLALYGSFLVAVSRGGGRWSVGLRSPISTALIAQRRAAHRASRSMIPAAPLSVPKATRQPSPDHASAVTAPSPAPLSGVTRRAARSPRWISPLS